MSLPQTRAFYQSVWSLKACDSIAAVLKALRPALLLGVILISQGAAPGHTSERPSWWSTAQDHAEQDNYLLADTPILDRLKAAEPDLLIVDTRSDYEFASGHIPDAVNLEFDLGDQGDLSEEKKQAFLALLGPETDRPVVIYCRSFR